MEKHRIAYHEKELGQLFCDDSSKQIVRMLLDECALSSSTMQSKRVPGLYFVGEVVNVNAFEGVASSLLRHASASLDGEGKEARLARRKRGWIADVQYIETPC